ncbi:hypothetical protein GGI21_005737, partial [Coemansia aciculifera]
MAFCLSDGLMKVDYDDEEEYVYSEEEEDMGYSDYDAQSPEAPTSAKLSQAEKQASTVLCGSYGDNDNYFDEDDDGEQPTSAMKTAGQPWEVDFLAHDSRRLNAKQEEIIGELEPLLAVSRESTAVLLRFYEWNSEGLVEDYLGDSSKVLTKYGVHAHPPTPKVETGDENFECEICYCSGADESYLGL